MRYMMLVKGNRDYEAGIPPKKELIEAVAKHGAALARAGILLDTGGLMPSSKGARIVVSSGNLTVIDGPFSEAKEVIGGFSIFNLGSKHEALEEARKLMELHRLHWPAWEGEVEIRVMYEEDDDPCGASEHVGADKGSGSQ